MSDYRAMGEYEYPVLDGENSGWGSRRSWGNNSNQGLEGDFQVIAPLDQKQSWFKTYWRPAIAWQYFAVCIFDFIIMPLVMAYFFYITGQDFQPWQSLTLSAGGFYHVAMGAIIGVTAFGRSQEKMKGLE